MLDNLDKQHAELSKRNRDKHFEALRVLNMPIMSYDVMAAPEVTLIATV